MVKKIIFILLTLLVLAVASEYLVGVELDEQRLSRLSAKGLKILAELENTAIVLISHAELDKLQPFGHQILDTQPQEGDYYLILSVDPMIDLSLYGDILLQDGDDCLLKVYPGMHGSLVKQKVMITRLSFTPMVFDTKTEQSAMYPVAPLPEVSYNYIVQEMVNLVDADTILNTVQRLQDYGTRYSTHDSCFAAADHIYDKLIAYGCDSAFLQYHTSGYAPNVIGVKHGEVHPDSIYAVVCGHFDATSYMAPDIAPGADDNASGTAAMLEAARIMNDYDFEYSIRYIAFSGEEQGLYGSQFYAQLARNQNDSILGVINADMIAYADVQPETLDVFAKPSNPACEPFADFFIAAADTYTTLLTTKRMTTTMIYSDHAPFWNQGYVALCNIEDFWVENPYYHTPGDTIGAGYNDHAFCTEVTKAQIAALALLAIPYDTGIEELAETELASTRLTVRPSIGRGSFVISLMTESSKPVDLGIYDVTGRIVRKLQVVPSGISHQSSQKWDGTDDKGNNLPGGIYFVQLDGTQTRVTSKFVLLR